MILSSSSSCFRFSSSFSFSVVSSPLEAGSSSSELLAVAGGTSWVSSCSGTFSSVSGSPPLFAEIAASSSSFSSDDEVSCRFLIARAFWCSTTDNHSDNNSASSLSNSTFILWIGLPVKLDRMPRNFSSSSSSFSFGGSGLSSFNCEIRYSKAWSSGTSSAAIRSSSEGFDSQGIKPRGQQKMTRVAARRASKLLCFVGKR
mmetsp:Transcript_101486/g.293631  ORF Transcript_101486/g.293631 Transcript_101486/m.293631 type:complete len:201 (-) Transcript_101486:423-1025(-)